MNSLLASAQRAPRVITEQYLVYCAGPITGLSYADATAWYDEVDKAFPNHIVPVFPLRGKTWLHGEISVADNYLNKHPLSTQEGIMTRDKLDVMRADALLVNLLGTQKVSIGTVIEIAWAHLLQKPVVLMMEKNNIHQHAMVRGCGSLIVESLEMGIDSVIRIISPVYPT